MYVLSPSLSLNFGLVTNGSRPEEVVVVGRVEDEPGAGGHDEAGRQEAGPDEPVERHHDVLLNGAGANVMFHFFEIAVVGVKTPFISYFRG
jgi:hypothetical protein